MANDIPRLVRTAERRTDLDFLEGHLNRDTTLLVPLWREQAILQSEGLALPTVGTAKDLLDASSEVVFLGLVGENAAFGVDISKSGSPLDHPAFTRARFATDSRQLLAQLSDTEAELALYARALLLWHKRHPFCSVCGKPTRPKDGGHARACQAPECRAQHFPRTDPCVLILVHDGEQCLLGRQPSWPKGMYSALAGFVEPCEDLESAAAREVLEEAGIVIGAPRYYASQPWPFPASLMVGFEAEPKTREISCKDAELEDARWFTRAELAAVANAPREEGGLYVPPPFSLAGKLIARFIAQVPGSSA
jgi:NAD+ diphosphatase